MNYSLVRVSLISPVTQVLKHMRVGVAMDRAKQRSNSFQTFWPLKILHYMSTGLIQETCVLRCTRRLSLVRISVIVLYQKKVFPVSLNCLRELDPVDVIRLVHYQRNLIDTIC